MSAHPPMSVVEMFITLFGGLAVFLFGMKTMSEGLQKVAGSTMRAILSRMTKIRFAGVFTGMLVTSVVQSSGATTIMLVSFVSAGLISLTQSIGVVMGANIGTTVTGWLVAFFGFKMDMMRLAFPALFIGILPRMVGFKRLYDAGEVLLGFGLLFLGLNFMKQSMGSMENAPALLEFVRRVSADTLLLRMATVGVGRWSPCSSSLRRPP